MFGWRHASPLSSWAVNVVSGFLSSWHMDRWLSLEVPQGCHTCHRVWCRYLGWQSCQCRGIRFMCSVLAHRGFYGIVARPLEFLSILSWDRLLLRCDGKPRIPLPMKQVNGPSSRDEEGKSGLFLSCGGTLGVPLKWRVLLGFRDPMWEIPPINSSCGETWWACRVRSQGILCLSIYPETKMKNSPTLC